MITEYIRYWIAANNSAAFEADYARAAEHLAAAPQCQDYELSRCVEDPERYTLCIHWTSMDDHLEGFRDSDHFPPFLAAIERYVGSIQEMWHYRTTEVAGEGAAVPSLYEWMGGVDALRRLTEAFYTRVRQDLLLAPVFAAMPPHHHERVALWFAEVFGGPKTYSREHGGHGHMISRHMGRRLTEEQRRRWLEVLLETADEVGLPTDPEFRASFTGYLEWGSRMAVLLSAPGADPQLDERMPTWSWTVPPWQPR